MILFPVPGTTTGGLICIDAPVPKSAPCVLVVGGGLVVEDDAMVVAESSDESPRQAPI